MEGDTVNNQDGEYKLTLFSNARRAFEEIQEKLYDHFSEAALEEDVCLSFKNEQSVSLNSDCHVVSDVDPDEDDEPLQSRLKQTTNEKSKANCKRGSQNVKKRITRSQTCLRKKKANPTIVNTPAVVAIETVSSTDSDDDIICEEPVIRKISVDLNSSGAVDLTFDDDVEDENDLVSVKINWMGHKMHRFELRKHQKFTTVFETLAVKESVPKEKILLILRDKIFINKDDSPDSLKLSIVDLIEGGITKEVHSNITKKGDTQPVAKNMLEFKCVLKDQKKPLLVAIKKTDKMHCLMVKTSEQLECPLENLKFKFEGEELDSDATADDLDLEGGEVFEVIVKT